MQYEYKGIYVTDGWAWYLGKNSQLNHRFHLEDPPEVNQLNESDLTPDQVDWIKEMYLSGITSGDIASVMNGYFDKKGRKGEFLTQTIKNITQQIAKESEVIAGIDRDFSVAGKTLAYLNQ